MAISRVATLFPLPRVTTDMREGGRTLSAQSPNATTTTTAANSTNTTTQSGAGGPLSQSTTKEPASQQASESLTGIANWWLEWFKNWGFPQDVAKLLLTVLVLIVTWYASKYVTQMLGRRVARRFRRPSVSRTVLRIIRMSVYGVGILFIIVYIYEIDGTNIVLSVTVFSAMVGVVLAPIVGSVISGLFVLADQPYEVGDMIELAETGQRGFVEDITIRYTKIFTLENTFLVVPNGSMRERDVINHSAEDTRTRYTLDIGVTYESDIEKARTLIENAARDIDGVIQGGPDIRIGSSRYPAAPTCFIDQFANSSVKLRLRYWTRDPYKPLTMRSRIQEAVWKRLDDVDVELAYPHSHVVFDETSGELNVNMTQESTVEDRPPRAPAEPEADD